VVAVFGQKQRPVKVNDLRTQGNRMNNNDVDKCCRG
jgi:hypothetical protein